MDRESLREATRITLKDPYSADSITLGMKSRDGLLIEEFYLKEMGSPSPKAEVYDNILCLSIRSEALSGRPVLEESPVLKESPVLIVLQPGGPGNLDKTRWLLEAAASGIVLIGMEVRKGEPLDKTVSRALRVVSYADLRRDIIGRDRIFLYGEGEPGTRALIAGALDERVAGIMVLDPEVRFPIEGERSLSTAEAAGLLPPRRLACLGLPDIRDIFAETTAAYARMGKGSRLRLETGRSEGLLKELSLWVTEQEDV